MSIRVLSRVMQESDEKLGRRLILLAIADDAHDDGIAWTSREDIAHKTRMSKQHVSELITALAEDGALEVRKAQRGRRRINVYRVILPGLLEPNYDRLPFILNQPFTGSEIPTSSSGDEVGSTGSTRSDLPVNPASSPYIEPSTKPSVVLAASPRTRADRDAIWDALTDVFGPPLTRTAESLRGKIVSSLLQAEATPEQIRSAPAAYRERMPAGTTFTETALEKHWTLLQQPVEAVRGSGPNMKYGRRDVSAGEMLAIAERLKAERLEQEGRLALEPG